MYFFSGDEGSVNSPITAIEQYVSVVGLPQVPPTWAFGFHLCRWGYTDLAAVQNAIDSMRNANIPLETQWSDIDWMDRYRSVLWPKVRNAPDCACYLVTLCLILRISLLALTKIWLISCSASFK